jgi:hypothetical protein
MNTRYLVKYGREIVRPFKVGPEVLEPDLVSSRGCLARRSEFGAQLHLLDAASASPQRLVPSRMALGDSISKKLPGQVSIGV